MKWQVVPAASGVGLRLKRGWRLRVIDTEGGQTGDLLAYSSDGRERISNGRSFDAAEKIYLSTGDVILSDLGNSMLAIMEDEVGKHDFLYASCNGSMYKAGPDDSAYHPNCTDNLSRALREVGIDPGPMASPFNLFMNTEVQSDGRLAILPSKTSVGKSVTFRAEMDLVLAVSACPAKVCNGGNPPRPLGYEILEA